MSEQECVQFLQWSLPKLQMQWSGFRKVRNQVCKRIARRITELQLADTHAYREFLETHPGEWEKLDGMCRISVTRFYRDKRMFAYLEHEVIPELVRLAKKRSQYCLKIWSAGCASGEEPYTLAIIWALCQERQFPDIDLQIIATDVDRALLKRAENACYPFSSVKNLPQAWRQNCFRLIDNRCCLNKSCGRNITFCCQDIRAEMPAGKFDMILCRNLILTYYEPGLQQALLARIQQHLQPGGVLVIGVHEELPEGISCFTPSRGRPEVYKFGQETKPGSV